MMKLMGGPNSYRGKTQKSAHQHILITEELFELRARILSRSISEAGINNELRINWLHADAALKKSLVKSSIDECSVVYATQPILDLPK